MSVHTYKTEIDGKEITVETGKLETQANASFTVRMGDTVVLATVTLSKRSRGMDFFPLMVDYEEKFYAAGRIKGPRFSKREGRPSSEAILTGRMIDRGLRPLFPQDMRNDVQIICTPLSFDGETKPDIVAMIAACTALHVSDVPFDGPIAGMRIGWINGDFVVNPTVEEIPHSDLQLITMGDGERIMMVDCDAQEVPDEIIAQACEKAMSVMGPLAKFIDDIRKDIGKEKKKDDELNWAVRFTEEEEAIAEEMKTLMVPLLDKYLFGIPKGSKGERKEKLKGCKEEVVATLAPKHVKDDRDEEATKAWLDGILSKFFMNFVEEQVTKAILDKDQRVDGRKLTDIRELSAEVALLPRTHGSGHFKRGETHILSTVTLGAPGDTMLMENMETEGEKKYYHHYNFPPYSVGEVKPLRGAGRREIGHGALAEKALKPMLPTDKEFPYTIRVVSEVLSSNGSSSMGSTCGSTLALMDAGVPIKKPVAGLAMGLASDGKRWKVLTDLQDLEDGKGGMDWKVTATRDGITAIQMDTKTRGLSLDIIKAAMPQTRQGLNQILDVIEKAIPKPREELSPYAPRIIAIQIDPEKIGDVIGPGGKVIRALTDELDLDIDIEDDGMVYITSTDAERAAQAEKRIKDIVKVVELGEIYEDAEVVNILDFGAFLKLTGSQDGMLHVSEIEWARVENIHDKIKLGDKITVKVVKIDGRKVDVSRRALLPKPEDYVEEERPRRRSGPRKGGPRRGGDRRGGGRPRGGGGDRKRPPRTKE